MIRDRDVREQRRYCRRERAKRAWMKVWTYDIDQLAAEEYRRKQANRQRYRQAYAAYLAKKSAHSDGNPK